MARSGFLGGDDPVVLHRDLVAFSKAVAVRDPGLRLVDPALAVRIVDRVHAVATGGAVSLSSAAAASIVGAVLVKLFIRRDPGDSEK